MAMISSAIGVGSIPIPSQGPPASQPTRFEVSCPRVAADFVPVSVLVVPVSVAVFSTACSATVCDLVMAIILRCPPSV
ncbi:unnamed protein product [Linum trigynum]|uniref:Uncharacterized protein n=1 Tax=Linum trigynum TaxID=586398 RepID=A0AAV2CRT1_9ROSI